MNELCTSKDYLVALKNQIKENKWKKDSLIISVVPSDIRIDHIINLFLKSKLKNLIEIVSICTKVNLNNVVLNER